MTNSGIAQSAGHIPLINLLLKSPSTLPLVHLALKNTSALCLVKLSSDLVLDPLLYGSGFELDLLYLFNFGPILL